MLVQSIFVYVGLVLMMALLSKYANEKNRTFYLLLPILIFTFVFGFRYGVGIDYYAYTASYDNWGLSDFAYKYERYEPGYLLLLELCSKLKLISPWFHSALVFLQIFFLFMAFREHKEILPALSFVLIFSGIVMVGYMNGVRQAIAFCIFAYSVQFIVNNKPLPYVALILLAASFHKSALVLLPFYLIWKGGRSFFNNTKVQLFLLFLFVGSIFINPIQYVIDQVSDMVELLSYDNYLDSTAKLMATERSFGMFDLLKLILYIIVINYSPKMKKHYDSKLFNVMYDLFLIGVFSSYFFKGSSLFLRFFLYFSNFESVIFAFTLYYLYINRDSNRVMPRYAYVVLYFILSFGRLMYYSEDNTCQYITYFQEDLKPEKERQFNLMSARFRKS